MKTVGTWSVDIDVKSWIDQKIANKSAFVNRILKNAMVDEYLRQEKKKQRPKCTLCKSPMGLNHVGEWICVSIHCEEVSL